MVKKNKGDDRIKGGIVPEANMSFCASFLCRSLSRHGDLLYVGFAEAAPAPTTNKTSTVVQDAVDDYLDSQTGLIKRDKDTKLYVITANHSGMDGAAQLSLAYVKYTC